jgi:hypothetical protein
MVTKRKQNSISGMPMRSVSMSLRIALTKDNIRINRRQKKPQTKPLGIINKPLLSAIEKSCKTLSHIEWSTMHFGELVINEFIEKNLSIP